MQLLDLSFPHPADNIALDEALLLDAEENAHAEPVLRLWESPVPFVVLGLAGRVAEEVDIDACEQDGISILRRTSGGGTVVQGPGCLNYSFILPFGLEPALQGIHSSNAWILGRIAQALSELCGRTVHMEGTSDLVLDGRKFSGNAQKRKRRWLLFHGTILSGFDLQWIVKYLRQPPRQPEYRAQRAHADFVRNFPASLGCIRAALVKEWEAYKPYEWTSSLSARCTELQQKQFALAEWNYKF